MSFTLCYDYIYCNTKYFNKIFQQNRVLTLIILNVLILINFCKYFVHNLNSFSNLCNLGHGQHVNMWWIFIMNILLIFLVVLKWLQKCEQWVQYFNWLSKPRGSVCLMKKTDSMDYGLFMSMWITRGSPCVTVITEW